MQTRQECTNRAFFRTVKNPSDQLQLHPNKPSNRWVAEFQPCSKGSVWVAQLLNHKEKNAHLQDSFARAPPAQHSPCSWWENTQSNQSPKWAEALIFDLFFSICGMWSPMIIATFSNTAHKYLTNKWRWCFVLTFVNEQHTKLQCCLNSFHLDILTLVFQCTLSRQLTKLSF